MINQKEGKSNLWRKLVTKQHKLATFNLITAAIKVLSLHLNIIYAVLNV